MCVGATEESSATAEMQDSRFQEKNKNKHVEKYFKRPTSTNVHKYTNEVKMRDVRFSQPRLRRIFPVFFGST